MFYARSNAEAHLFMDLNPCGCGDRVFDRKSAVVECGAVLCSEYIGPCRTCGAIRTFVFALPDEILRPVPGRFEYGGADPSRLLDPGEWMAVADEHAKRNPGTARDLAVACAAIDEILKFIPIGADRSRDRVPHRPRQPGLRHRARALSQAAARSGTRDLSRPVGVHPMKIPGAPRTVQEVRYFVDESPCETCGHRGLTDAMPNYLQGRYTGQCASCLTIREWTFEPLKAKTHAPPCFLSGETTPTTVFTADQLRAIADRALATVMREPTEYATVAALEQGQIHVVTASIALNELAKFHPGDSALAAEAAAMPALWSAHKAARPIVEGKPGAQPPPRGLGERFDYHRQWLARGRTGDGRLLFKHEHWKGIGMATGKMQGALFEDTTFENIDFSYGEFDGATFRRVRFLRCSLSMAKLDGATFEQVDMTGSVLSLASLLDCTITGGDWQGIAAGRSTWSSRVTRVDLRNAGLRDTVLDGAVFESCDFRDANFSRRDVVLDKLGTARRTRFVECDLRGAKIEGWRLDGTELERCKLHGTDGKPELEGAIKVIGQDLSPDGDGSVVGMSWPL